MVKTTSKQKILLILLGIFLTFILLELGLRITGLIFVSQRSKNLVNFTEDEFVILSLGDSTTENTGYSWPEQLEPILNERNQDVKFRIVNEGFGGITSPLILSRLKGHIEKYNPEMVITMMGIHDSGTKVYYTESSKSKISLFFENIRIYKLMKLLKIHLEYTINPLLSNGKEETSKEDLNNYSYYLTLADNYKEKGLFGEAESYYKKSIYINYSPHTAYESLAVLYLDYGMSDKAEKNLFESIKYNKTSYSAYLHLGLIYESKGNYKNAEEFLKKSINLNPLFCPAYTSLIQLYIKQNRLEEGEEYAKKIIELKPNCLSPYIALASIYEINGNHLKAEKLYDKIAASDGFASYGSFESKESYEDTSKNITKYHYRLLYDMLKEENIKLVVMQYPTRNIHVFKSFFTEEQQKDIIFISNKENFEKALTQGKYEDYFIDRFAGDFGHCTYEGNRLIAENVANAILKELN